MHQKAIEVITYFCLLDESYLAFYIAEPINFEYKLGAYTKVNQNEQEQQSPSNMAGLKGKKGLFLGERSVRGPLGSTEHRLALRDGGVAIQSRKKIWTAFQPEVRGCAEGLGIPDSLGIFNNIEGRG